MLKKVLQAIVAGLAIAIVVITVSLLWQKRSENSEIMSYHSAVKKASPAVVNIYSQIADESISGGYRLNLGSGVIMTENGYILTNHHVISDAYQIAVFLQNGESFRAVLVGSDRLTDLAVLKIERDKLPTIPQNRKRAIKVGDVVLAIGNPYNLGQSVTQGIISAVGRNTISESFRQNFIQTDASISKGNSGGALINSAGELVGINTLSFKNSNEISALSITDSDIIPEGLNFAIPISLAQDVMEKIIQDGRVIRGYFGVSSDPFYVNRLGGEVRGVVLTGVVSDGPAAQAGLKENDIILKIGEVNAISPTQMMELLATTKPNTSLNVLVSRNGQLMEFNVIVGEFPEHYQ